MSSGLHTPVVFQWDRLSSGGKLKKIKKNKNNIIKKNKMGLKVWSDFSISLGCRVFIGF